MQKCVWCCVLLSTVLLTPAIGQENWPEYRGPSGDGMALSASLPSHFSETNKVKWKTPIHGRGWSSPVVWGEQIWLTTATEDGTKMSVVCVDLESGEIVRDRILHENESPAFCHPTNSYASPTPVVEEGRVYVHFGSYGTTCLDSKTGETVWQRKDLECDHFRGPASSPILYGDKLIVAYDGFDLQYVIALDKQTGETLWKSDRDIDYGTDNGDWMKAYGTGSVFQLDGKPVLIYPSASATIAYDVETGKPIWTVYHEGMNTSVRPVMAENGLVILTNGMGKMVAVKPRGSGNITDSNIAWTLSRGVAKRPSPLVIGERLYMISDNGIASCIDVENGRSVWRERLGGAFAASPVFDGENIFAFSEEGDVHVFKPGDEFLRVAQLKLGDGFLASPAIVGDRMILRSVSHLYCISDE